MHLQLHSSTSITVAKITTHLLQKVSYWDERYFFFNAFEVTL